MYIVTILEWEGTLLVEATNANPLYPMITE